MDNQDKKAKMMGEEKINTVLIKLALPAIVGMLITAIYNLVDTMFVGKLGTSAIGAASVAFPLFMLISAVGLAFGIGAASYISRLLGEGNKERADRTTSTAFFTSLVSGIILTVIVFLFLNPILRIFGSTDTIMPYAIKYSKILVLGSTFTVLNMTMNNILRAEGSAKFSMIALSAGALLNIVLDPIFIFVFDMGIAGASLATVLSQIVSTIMLLSYFLKGKSYVKIAPKFFTPSKEIYFEMFKIGIPTFLRQFFLSLSMGLINTAAMPYGDAAVASIGITNRVFSLGSMVIFGYSQGFQPVAGFNYGAGKFDRLKESIQISLKWTSIFTTITSILFFIFSEAIIGVFSKDPNVISIGSKSLKAVMILFPLFGFQMIYATLFQALGRGKEASVLSLSRQGIFLIPAILFFPKFFGLTGVIFSQPFADLCTILLTALFALSVNKEIAKKSAIR